MSYDVIFDFDPFVLAGVEPPKDPKDRELALEEIAEYVVDKVKDSCDNTTSPVAGYGAFPKLSPDYKKEKRSRGEPGEPNLTLDGDMLDALECISDGEGLKLQITGAQGPKADGHNNHSGKSELPLRRFIPEEGETFKKDILAGIRTITKRWSSGD